MLKLLSACFVMPFCLGGNTEPGKWHIGVNTGLIYLILLFQQALSIGFDTKGRYGNTKAMLNQICFHNYCRPTLNMA